MYLYVCECVLLTARVVRMPFHRWDRRMVVCVSECASSRHQGCCILWDSACRRRPVEWLGRWPRSCPLSVLLCSCSCASACWSVGDGRCLRGSGLGGSEVRPSSSSPLLLQLTLDVELRSSGPWLLERVDDDVGSCREGNKLTSQISPVVKQVTGKSLVAVGSSASGYLSGRVSGGWKNDKISS